MASTGLYNDPPELWIPLAAVSFIVFIPNAFIFIRERRKRQNRTVPYPSKYISISSYLCITLGPTFAINQVLLYFDGICMITNNIEDILCWGQFVAMECFQLFRIYYCFSQQKIHSKQGYPRWVFILMFILLFFFYILAIFLHDLAWPVSACYLETDGDSVFEYVQLMKVSTWQALAPISFLFAVCLDVTTVLLYGCKIRSFSRYKHSANDAIYKRLLCILRKILILTFFYQIFTVCLTVLYLIGMTIFGDIPISPMLLSIISLSVSISMYLMQDHNSTEYMLFIKSLYRSKLYFCCCCLSGMVKDEYQVIMSDMDKTEMQRETEAKRNTELDLRTVSPLGSGMELSIETRTVVHTGEGEPIEVVYSN